jgi:hypothetical protein
MRRWRRLVSIAMAMACASPQGGSVASPRKPLEDRYAQLAAAIRTNRLERILAFQSPAFTSVNVTGQVFDYQAMADYTRRLTSAIDSVLHVQNRIRRLQILGRDTAVVHVCQEFSRIQRIGDGHPHRVDTSALQTETWVRDSAGWFRTRVEDVHGTRWFVDGVRVDPTRPYTAGMPPYRPAVDSVTGCGRL